MHNDLVVGLNYEYNMIVKPEHTAIAFKSGSVDVLSTPCLIANMEMVCYKAVDDKLDNGYTTVGTKINIDHVAATPINMEVNFNSTLISIDNARLLFLVKAYDQKELIGTGTHERYIINIEKFISKVNNKNI